LADKLADKKKRALTREIFESSVKTHGMVLIYPLVSYEQEYFINENFEKE
jgi:hypothetical protein